MFVITQTHIDEESLLGPTPHILILLIYHPSS